MTTTNAGYRCTLTVQTYTNEFRQDVLGEELEGTDKCIKITTKEQVKNAVILNLMVMKKQLTLFIQLHCHKTKFDICIQN